MIDKRCIEIFYGSGSQFQSVNLFLLNLFFRKLPIQFSVMVSNPFVATTTTTTGLVDGGGKKIEFKIESNFHQIGVKSHERIGVNLYTRDRLLESHVTSS